MNWTSNSVSTRAVGLDSRVVQHAAWFASAHLIVTEIHVYDLYASSCLFEEQCVDLDRLIVSFMILSSFPLHW